MLLGDVVPAPSMGNSNIVEEDIQGGGMYDQQMMLEVSDDDIMVTRYGCDEP